MREGEVVVAHQRLRRAEDILSELLATLDHERGGDIASHLQGIYVFCSKHLLDARRNREPENIEKVSELLAELRDAWAQIAGA